jgi:hypothetical protein
VEDKKSPWTVSSRQAKQNTECTSGISFSSLLFIDRLLLDKGYLSFHPTPAFFLVQVSSKGFGERLEAENSARWKPGMVVHDCSPSCSEAERRIESSKPVWATS